MIQSGITRSSSNILILNSVANCLVKNHPNIKVRYSALFFFGYSLISWSCCNKLPQFQKLKTTEIYLS